MKNSGDHDLPSWVIPSSQGFVFATTGEEYTALARRAARTMRSHMPDCTIDIFTDQVLEDEVFDQIHQLRHSWFRPKMEALRRSRFERTILMDADLVVLTDINEAFAVLDHCDIAGAIGVTRGRQMLPANDQIPRSLPPINSGVLVARASQKVQDFSLNWEKEVRRDKASLDQPTFRKLLCQSDLRFLPLGGEYNILFLDILDVWPKNHGAPRILHVRDLHNRPMVNPEEPITLEEAVGPTRAAHVEQLLASDWSLGGNPSLKVLPPIASLRNELRSARRKGVGRPALSRSLGLRKKSRGVANLFARFTQSKKAPKTVTPRPKKEPARKFSPYWSAVLALASVRTPLRICVVGANDGRNGDPLFHLIKGQLATETELVLFEPQPYLHSYLSQNYAFHPACHIINGAVGPNSELILHAIKPDAWQRFNPPYANDWPDYRAPTGITSSNRELVLRWVRKQLPKEDAPESLLEEIQVPCSDLISTLDQFGMPETIDVLQVDTEGFDDEVIYACNLERTRPSIIYFEENHLSKERSQKLRQYLENNYRLNSIGRDILAIRKCQQEPE